MLSGSASVGDRHRDPEAPLHVFLTTRATLLLDLRRA